MVKRYSKLEHDILIVFDKRISCFGMHTYDHVKQLHTIRISPLINVLNEKGTFLDEGAEKHNIISTLLHEICHAQQREFLKQSFQRYDYHTSRDIRNPEMAEYYSKCELEARTYECENILDAVELYDSSCI
jgi:Ca2+-binding EF-hand superfamily protein